MSDFEKNAVESADLLEKSAKKLSKSTVSLGFDAFVDTIARPISSGNSDKVESVYATMSEFVDFLQRRSGRSCSVELAESAVKFGGNTPICAAALSRMNISANCIGNFGLPETEPVFRAMPPQCSLFSVGNPGKCIALEFNDSKIMLAVNNGINQLNWEDIKSAVPAGQLAGLFQSSDMLCFLNWSEIPNSTKIIKGISEEILPNIKTSPKILFDFSDCTRRTESELREILALIGRIAARFEVIVSMNENEADQVRNVLKIPKSQDYGLLAQQIGKRLGCGWTVFHFLDHTYGWDGTMQRSFLTRKVLNPKITTGAGDNFNAGLCVAAILSLPFENALAVASMLSSCYVMNGESPDIEELLRFMRRYAAAAEIA